MSKDLAINSRNAVFSYVAFVWCEETDQWRFLCAGASVAEFQERLSYWIAKGTNREAVNVYETNCISISE